VGHTREKLATQNGKRCIVIHTCGGVGLPRPQRHRSRGIAGKHLLLPVSPSVPRPRLCSESSRSLSFSPKGSSLRNMAAATTSQSRCFLFKRCTERYGRQCDSECRGTGAQRPPEMTSSPSIIVPSNQWDSSTHKYRHLIRSGGHKSFRHAQAPTLPSTLGPLGFTVEHIHMSAENFKFKYLLVGPTQFCSAKNLNSGRTYPQFT